MATYPETKVSPTVMAELRAMGGSRVMVNQKVVDDLKQKVCSKAMAGLRTKDRSS